MRTFSVHTPESQQHLCKQSDQHTRTYTGGIIKYTHTRTRLYTYQDPLLAPDSQA